MPARANLLMALPAAKGVELQGCRSRRSWSGCTVIDVSINLCAGSINREGDFLGIEAGRQPWSYAPLPTLLLPFQETESSRKSHSIGPILRVALLHLQGQELEHSISILVVESAAILPRHQGLYCSTRCSKPQVTTYSGDCRGMHPSVDELIGDVCTTCICTERRLGGGYGCRSGEHDWVALGSLRWNLLDFEVAVGLFFEAVVSQYEWVAQQGSSMP